MTIPFFLSVLYTSSADTRIQWRMHAESLAPTSAADNPRYPQISPNPKGATTMRNESTKDDKGVSIHIDKHQVFAPREVMTGGELRALVTPPIGPDRDLYLEVPGQSQDRLIGDSEAVTLKNGMHFYSALKNTNPGSRNAVA